MNRRQIVLIALAVIVAHAGLFWLLSGARSLPKVNVKPVVPPNFIVREAPWVDEETGERYIVREFQVSTKLALPDVLMQPSEASKVVGGDGAKGSFSLQPSAEAPLNP